MESECALTTNGMAAEHTSLSSLTDIFFNAAQYRQPDTTESLLQLWQLAVKEDPLLAAQLLLWLRDARGGAGERSAFRAILGALMKEPGQFKHNTIVKILKYIPEIGRYDDLKVLEGIGKDKRIGDMFLNPGPGYGGSCFPKDVRALISIAKDNDYQFSLLEEVENINNQSRRDIVRKARTALGDLRNKKIGILGLAFKANTDDMRDAPAIDIINLLQNDGAKLVLKKY